MLLTYADVAKFIKNPPKMAMPCLRRMHEEHDQKTLEAPEIFPQQAHLWWSAVVRSPSVIWEVADVRLDLAWLGGLAQPEPT